MGTDLTVGVAGATGALGRELVRVLDRAPWRPDELVPLARRATTVSHVDYGDERVAVDDLELQVLEALDLIFLALPAEDAAEVAAAALQEGVSVVDCSGALAESHPLVVPWINPEALQEARDGAVAVPSPEAALLGAALGPWARAGLQGPVQATVLVPASRFGRDGIEELSKQVVALFNAGTPPRRVFRDGLAFDLLPAVGELQEDGWTSREQQVAREVTRLVGWEGPVDVTVVGVPVFSGVAAQLTVQPSRRVPAELAERLLRDGGLKGPDTPAVRDLPRPRRVEGQPFAKGARVRLGADGQTLHAWLAGDNLRGTAAAALAAAAVLLGDRARP